MKKSPFKIDQIVFAFDDSICNPTPVIQGKICAIILSKDHINGGIVKLYGFPKNNFDLGCVSVDEGTIRRKYRKEVENAYLE